MSFFNLYRHDFIRVAVAVPEVRVADPAFNGRESLQLLEQAARERALLCVFPELGLAAYSCEDLFHQEALLAACQSALKSLLAASEAFSVLGLVGLPLCVDGALFNAAVVFARGRILGVVPKTYLPNYREFYELRQFAPAARAVRNTIELCGQADVPFGERLIFEHAEQPLLRLFVEICEDLWTPIPPSSLAALAGATLIANLSASNVIIGKADYRRQLASSQSARCIAAYVYSAAGFGESTTDLAWDGHGMIHEDGTLLGETERFARRSQLITAEVDLQRLAQDRMRTTSFGQAVERWHSEVATFRRVRFELPLPNDEQLHLRRTYERFPYVPSDPATRDERCREVYEIQVQGLVKRLRSMHSEKVVIGVSGGLDSTQALLVCVRAMDALQLPRQNVRAYTLPGFATSERTLDQAQRLMSSLGVSAELIDIRPSCMQMFQDIGHPFARGEQVFDLAFENVQAGERTSHLFRLANVHQAPVVGTGDLSELALGWCTYGVGDQMSHYNVNASVPKTLIQHLIRFVARTGELGGQETARVLHEVLETEISPELVPRASDGHPPQTSEAVVGPYELQDFHLYYALRYGFAPERIAFLAWQAWHDKSRGPWPDMQGAARHEYTLSDIKRWLGVFLKRFFAAQYKRSAQPNGPKVGSGGSLSPRGDWRAPSDAEAAAWLTSLERVPER